MKVSLVVDTAKNTVKVHRHNCSDITDKMVSGDHDFADQGAILDLFEGVQVTFLKCLKNRLPVSSSPVEADTTYVEPLPDVTPEVEPAPMTPAVTTEPQPAAVTHETTERAIESIESGTVVDASNQHLYKGRDIRIEALAARTVNLKADVYGKLMWMSGRTVVFKDANGAPKSRSAKNVRVTLV